MAEIPKNKTQITSGRTKSQVRNPQANRTGPSSAPWDLCFGIWLLGARHQHDPQGRRAAGSSAGQTTRMVPAAVAGRMVRSLRFRADTLRMCAVPRGSVPGCRGRPRRSDPDMDSRNICPLSFVPCPLLKAPLSHARIRHPRSEQRTRDQGPMTQSRSDGDCLSRTRQRPRPSGREDARRRHPTGHRAREANRVADRSGQRE